MGVHGLLAIPGTIRKINIDTKKETFADIYRNRLFRLIDFVVAGMSVDFLARAKVSFVKTAVLSSNDGGNTFNEEVVLTNKTDEQGK